MKDHGDLTKEISDLVETSVQKKIESAKTINVNFIKRDITKLLNDFIFKKTERKPMIMPVVMTVN